MKSLGAVIGAIVMGVCFSTVAVAQGPVAMPETPSGSTVEAKAAGAGSSKQSGKKSGKKQKMKKNKRDRSKSRRPREDSTYKVITS